MRSTLRLVTALIIVAAIGPPVAAAHHSRHPLVIGHRGSPGYLPDHTLQGYKLAIENGADYIEPDLVSTKDGVLIARHEPNITGTTNVSQHPEFKSREHTAAKGNLISIDGGDPEGGWFAFDFTLKEIKTLRAVQPLAFRSHRFDGKFEVPTFEQVLDLRERMSKKVHRQIGVYPETKHPTLHEQLGLPLEAKLLAALKRHGLNHRNSPVFIQSFEQSNLKKLNTMTPVPLVQLVDAWDVNPDGSLVYASSSLRPYDWTVSNDPVLTSRTYGYFATDAGLAEIRRYADVISPWKRYIVSSKAVDLNGDGTIGDENGDGLVNDADRQALPPTDLIQRAHAHGLKIHTWTFRNEPGQYLLSDYGGNPTEEYLQFYELGIDGVFSDYTDTAVVARRLFNLE
jgi:glycerophosphoryl diester phosphodiesterase